MSSPTLHFGPIERPCPVQCTGTVNGQPFYFRARGERWTLGVGGDVWLKPDWFYAQAYDKGAFEAGWMPDEEAMAFMRQGLDRYLSGEPSQWP